MHVNFIYTYQTSSGCGESYGCFISPTDCTGDACTYIIKWTDKNDTTDFEVAVKGAANGYSAIGKNKTKKLFCVSLHFFNLFALIIGFSSDTTMVLI